MAALTSAEIVTRLKAARRPEDLLLVFRAQIQLLLFSAERDGYRAWEAHVRDVRKLLVRKRIPGARQRLDDLLVEIEKRRAKASPTAEAQAWLRRQLEALDGGRA